MTTWESRLGNKQYFGSRQEVKELFAIPGQYYPQAYVLSVSLQSMCHPITKGKKTAGREQTPQRTALRGSHKESILLVPFPVMSATMLNQDGQRIAALMSPPQCSKKQT
jgi:hypothetical protein